MVTQVIVHVMPNEIDWFEWQAKQLKIGSDLLEVNDNVVIDVTLNLNIIDWEKSLIPKQFFIDKFNNILTSCFDWCKVISDINEDMSCMGALSKRRASIRASNADNFICLDCDIIFKSETLKILINASEAVTNEYYIITPQISKLWDTTWDVLVNEYYSKDTWGNEVFIDPYSIVNKLYGPIALRKIQEYKLGMGWFNLISANLLKKIDLPESLGSYGPDDTYIMFCSFFMKLANMDVQQFVLENIVVAENYKYRVNIYEKYLTALNNKSDERKQSELNFTKEVENFKQKLINYE